MTDRELIGQYVEAASQQAFGELVRRHAGWVYGCARRRVRDAHSAEDVTQAVFILLSQNATKVGGNERLAAWLFKATHYCSANALKQQARRQKHEREAAMQQQMAAGDEAANWEEIWPILDEAVRKLRWADREAVLLRFYQGMSVSELAGAIGTGEDAAKKRVQRAVERLREMLAKKGVIPGAGALSVVMAEKLTQAAPAGLVEAATSAAGGGGMGSAGVIAKGAIKMMAWTKMKAAICVALGVLVVPIVGAVLAQMHFSPATSQSQPTTNPTGTNERSSIPLVRVISVVKGHLTQIRDLQYQFVRETRPKASPEQLYKYRVDFAWQQEGWEKRSTQINEAGVQGVTNVAWNGRRSQRQDAASNGLRTGAEGTHREDFDQLEPLALLELRGRGKLGQPFSLADWLASVDVKVEGQERIDGHDTVIVSINETYSLPRRDGMVMKYWLDLSRGGLPLRSEMYVKEELRRKVSVTLADVAPSVFLPIECTVETFGRKDPTDPTDVWRMGEIHSIRIDPVTVKLNQGLKQDDFKVEFDKGTPVVNRDLQPVH